MTASAFGVNETEMFAMASSTFAAITHTHHSTMAKMAENTQQQKLANDKQIEKWKIYSFIGLFCMSDAEATTTAVATTA